MASTQSGAALATSGDSGVVAWSGTRSETPDQSVIDAHLSTRFLTPDDHCWTDDGAGTWITGHADGITYTAVPGTRRLTLHNRGGRDIAVLSMPRADGTADTRFTYVPRGASETLPDAGFHILQSDRVQGRPVMVGQITMTDGHPLFILDGPDTGEVDWSSIDPDGHYWKPGDPDFATPESPCFAFSEPLGRGVFHTWEGGEVAIHNRGDEPVAVLSVGADGPLDMVEIGAGDSAPIPAGDVVCYIQAPRTDGAPTLLGVLWIEAGVVMPSALPLPTYRDFLDHRYLDPDEPGQREPLRPADLSRCA